jgi:predicted enzyme related to lactoylglutathione lyase
MTGSVTHFEIYAEDDPNELADFYKELFDWQINKVPGIDYFQIETGPPEAGGIRGGLLQRPIQGPRSWVHYVAVDSLDEMVELVQSLGGKLVRQRQPFPRSPGMQSWRTPKATSSPCGRPTRPRFHPWSLRIDATNSVASEHRRGLPSLLAAVAGAVLGGCSYALYSADSISADASSKLILASVGCSLTAVGFATWQAAKARAPRHRFAVEGVAAPLVTVPQLVIAWVPLGRARRSCSRSP